MNIKDLSIISHRCLGFGFEANTLCAFTRALTSGVDEVEIDIRHTRDGGFFASHLPWYKDSSGRRKLMAWQSSDEAQASGRMSLAQALEVFIQVAPSGVRLRVEFKEGGREQEAFAMLSQYQMLERAVLVSWSRSALRVFRALSKDCMLSYSYLPGLQLEPPFFVPPWSAPSVLKVPELDIQSVNFFALGASPTKSLVTKIREKGAGLILSGCNNLERAQKALELGAQGVLTKNPIELLSLLGR